VKDTGVNPERSGSAAGCSSSERTRSIRLIDDVKG
jgi:hypothetical protein